MVSVCLCAGLTIIVILLIVKRIVLRRDIDALREEFAARLFADSNTGIRTASADPALLRLAETLDGQVKRMRLAQIRYEQGDEELKTAITNMSHDIRTPLTAICGYMELLKELPLSEEAKEYLAITDNRVQLLKELSEELFRYSVVMAASYEKRVSLSLNGVVEEWVAAFYGALPRAGIEPVTEFPERAVRRQLNPQALERILSNLMSNAVRYSDGDLVIRLSEDGTICFSNHAGGLDELSAAHLSDRFYTVNDGGTSTGLGLSIARALTKEMGGTFGVEYENGMLSIRVKFFGDDTDGQQM